MSLFLFVTIHLLIGLALIYFYGKLPKPLTTFSFVFLIMSFLYWGAVFIDSIWS